jgi:acetyl-CoA decarbonylase/synthase complex subunit beta
MFEDIPVDVGIIYEGERIRRGNMHVELGGPKIETKFELVRARTLDKVEDGKVEIEGPDLKDLKEGGSYPFGILVEVAGEQIEEELEGVVERRIHEYCNFIEGFMHLNQRYDIWCRLSKGSFEKGLNSFEMIGKVLMRLFKSELSIIDKIQVKFITNPTKIKEMYQQALEVYEARDARARGLKDEEVDSFYGCTLCQSFAPTHVCVITPQRYANCGAISWFDARAAARVDPKGPLYKVEVGEEIDSLRGEFSGPNKAVAEKSLGEITRVCLYTAFGYPHTSCGCFEAIAFYIPEVDGFGLVDRSFRGKTVNGLPFSTMADSTAGGRQIDGFHGVSIEYMRSPKFLQADRGWNRVVWVPSGVKERVKDFIPKELIDKIATEKDVESLDQLQAFLKEKEHPIVDYWEAAPTEVTPEEEREEAVITPQIAGTVIPVAGGGFRIILKNAKIHAEKVIIRPLKKGDKLE